MARSRRDRGKVSTNRHQQAYENRDNSGSNANRRQIFNFESLENTPKYYKPTPANSVKLDILEFDVTTNKHPLVKKGEMQVGDGDFALEVWIHRFVGPSKADTVCPKKNYGLPCPICEEAQKAWGPNKEPLNKKLYDAIKATHRAIMFVRPYEKGIPQEVQILDVSHYLFLKELLEKANRCANGSLPIPFSHPDDGSIVEFCLIEETRKGADGKDYKTPKFKDFMFLDREEEIPDEVLDQTFSLDAHLEIYSYEELEAIYYGQEEEASSFDKAPPVKKQEQLASIPAGRETAPASGAAETPKEETSYAPATQESIPPVETATEADSSTKSKEPSATASSNSGCPHGYAFGTDCDAKPECSNCPADIWDNCMAAQ